MLKKRPILLSLAFRTSVRTSEHLETRDQRSQTPLPLKTRYLALDRLWAGNYAEIRPILLSMAYRTSVRSSELLETRDQRS